ncbi:MAG: N-acetyl sugar amidotransferase, partial [Campylobacter sp.]|nr:N-acetyl sugar amidotransferase [Campylobacter sp.]
MRFCTKCVMPETKPNLHFDQDGVCDACRSQENKNVDIDWNARKIEFLELIKKYKKHPIYDCVIGVSGGKDSTFQVLTMLNLGLNPLCVCFEPTIPTKVGRKNLKNLNNLGVDIIHIKRDPIVYKKLAKEAFKRTGDNEWQNHLGIFTCVPRIAVNFGIPLIIWGESPQIEYGGPATSKDNNILDKNWLDKFGGLLGTSIEDMIGVDGLDEKDLYFYTYPSDEELKRVNVTGLF